MSDELSGRKARILVVEDNYADVDLLRWSLEGSGVDCELKVIQDGAEALDYVRQHSGSAQAPHDLAVLDLNVPKHDGLEILEAMRATPAFAVLPVAILTSSSSPRERTLLNALNVKHIIAKPLDLDEFMKIGRVLKQVLAGGSEKG